MKKIAVSLMAFMMLLFMATPASADWVYTNRYTSCTSGDVRAVTALRYVDATHSSEAKILGTFGYALGQIGSADRTNFRVNVSTPWYTQNGYWQTAGKNTKGVDMAINARDGQVVKVTVNIHFDLYWQRDRYCSVTSYYTL